jgi:hypothetical protein
MKTTRVLSGIPTITAGLMALLQPCFGQTWAGTDSFTSGISTNWTINTFNNSDQMTVVGANGQVSFLVSISTTNEQHASIVWDGTPAVSDDWTMDIGGHNSASWSDNGGSQLQLWLLSSANHGTSFRISMEGGYNPQFNGYQFNTEVDSAEGGGLDRQSVLAPNTTFGLRLVHRGGAAGDVEAWYDPTGNGTNWTLLDTMSMADLWPGAASSSTFTVAIASVTDYGPIAEGQLWADNFRITNSAIGAPANGALQVSITPSGAVSAGAEWQVNGGAYEKSAATVANLPSGAQTVTFKPIPGWNTPASQTVAITSGVTTKAAGVYTQQVEGNPQLTISSPKPGQSLTNPSLLASGAVTDKAAVTAVHYQLNGGSWTLATPANSWASWTANLDLRSGANTLSAYAVDASGSISRTNTVKFTYVLVAPLEVGIGVLGSVIPGTVTPNDDGKLLDIGAQYTLTAKAEKGFAFADWSGSISTNTPTLTFVMASNLSFTANFVDVTRPVLAILSPKVHQTLSTAAFSVTGRASDNVGVAQVLYQLNGTGWAPALTSNEWTNWTADVTLSPGANVVQAYAEDAAGNRSLTNSVSFAYEAAP